MSTIFGDPDLNPTLSGKQHAKNQTLTGTDNTPNNTLVGDVDAIIDQATTRKQMSSCRSCRLQLAHSRSRLKLLRRAVQAKSMPPSHRQADRSASVPCWHFTTEADPLEFTVAVGGTADAEGRAAMVAADAIEPGADMDRIESPHRSEPLT
jgi:hypothetical protein